MEEKVFDDIYVFITVAKCGSFYEAAKKMHSSHSTLLRRVQLLEDSLGVRLFYKNTKGISLTSFGKSLLVDVAPLYEDVANVLLGIKLGKNKQIQENKIKILMSVGIAEHFLYCIYPELVSKEDDFSIELNTYSPKQLKEDISYLKKTIRHYDVLVFDIAYQHILALDDWKIIARNVSSHKLFASQQYIEKYGMPKTIEDLQTHNCVCLNHGMKNHWKLFNKQKQSFYIQVNGSISVDLTTHVKNLVLDGQGIGLLPLIYKNYKSDFVEILPEYSSEEFELCYFCNTQSKSPSTIDKFMKTLKPIYIQTKMLL